MHKTGQRCAQIMAMDHHIHDSVIKEKFSALKTFGQTLANGLLDHALSTEPDTRAGFGKVDVTQHGVGGADAAKSWIGEHDDVYASPASRSMLTPIVTRGIC